MTPLTPSEIEREKAYRREERLAILCGNFTPTEHEASLANADAERWEREYRESLKPEQRELL